MEKLEFLLIYVDKIVVVLGIISVFLIFLPILKSIVPAKKSRYKSITVYNVPNEFENIYKELYSKYINSLEKIRKKNKKATILMYIVFSLLGLGFILLMLRKKEIALIGACSIALAILLMIITTIGNKGKDNTVGYEENYKRKIVSEFIKLINNQLAYLPEGKDRFELRNEYMEANFDQKVFTNFDNDDTIEGYLAPEIFVKLSDLCIRKITGSGKNIQIEQVFQGIFVITNCNNNIGTYVKIAKNKLKISAKDDRVEMDSKEFEKYFDVFSEDKILATRLLTHDIMECLIDFYKKYNLDFEIVFKRNKIYLRFFTGPMFEPKVFGSSMDKQVLFTYYCILKFIVDITKRVNVAVQEIET